VGHTEAVINCAKLGEQDKAIISERRRRDRKRRVATRSRLFPAPARVSRMSTDRPETKMQQCVSTTVRSVRGTSHRFQRADSVGLTVSPLIRYLASQSDAFDIPYRKAICVLQGKVVTISPLKMAQLSFHVKIY